MKAFGVVTSNTDENRFSSCISRREIRVRCFGFDFIKFSFQQTRLLGRLFEFAIYAIGTLATFLKLYSWSWPLPLEGLVVTFLAASNFGSFLLGEAKVCSFILALVPSPINLFSESVSEETHLKILGFSVLKSQTYR